MDKKVEKDIKERRVRPPKIGLVTQLIAKSVVLFVILLGIICFFIFNYQKNFLARHINGKNMETVKTYASFISDAKEMSDDLIIVDYIERLKRVPTVRYVMVLDGRVKVLFHSDMREVGKTYQDAASLKAVTSEEGLQQELSYEGEALADFSAPVLVSHKKAATLRVGFSPANIEAGIEDIRENLSIVAIVGLIVVIVSSFIINSGIGVAINHIKQAAKDVSRGEIPEKIEVPSGGELGYLARVLERMFDKFRENTAVFEEQKKELKKDYDFFVQNICEFLGDGVIVLDENNKIIFANEIASGIVGFQVMACLGKHMLEMIKNAELVEFVNVASQKVNTLNEREILSLNCSALVKVVREISTGRPLGVVIQLKSKE
ncbi:MAG: HAMP domain-containing protein [bacterium]